MVRFYEIMNEAGDRLAPVDPEEHFLSVVADLPPVAREHWHNGLGLRVRGGVYRQTPGSKPRTDLVVLDRVHREPAFRYVLPGGGYRDHQFEDDETEFAEPKYLAFFERNIVAAFTTGIRMPSVEACLNTWRAAKGMQPIILSPVVDADRLQRLSEVDRVGILQVQLPSEVAREIYKARGTPLAGFFRDRAKREGRVMVSLRIDPGNDEASSELLDELDFLLQEDTYQRVAAAEDSQVEASFFTEGSNRSRHHNFLGQPLAISVKIEVPEPESGPQPAHASEALVSAFAKRQERLFQVVPE